MKRKFLTVLLVATWASPALASANDFQLTAGGTYMFDSADTEFSFTAATLKGAYFFTDTLGFEAEGSIGLGGVDNYSNSGIDFSLKNQFGLYAVGRWPVSTNGEFFGRIGARGGNFDSEIGNISATIDYYGFSLGAGYTHYLGEGLGIRGEITTSGASLDGNVGPEGNLTSATISMTYRFGDNKK